MSFLKGFLISFVLSFLAFATIILYGGSFALSLIEDDEQEIQAGEQGNVSDTDTENTSVHNTSHKTFSFALVITDEFVEDEFVKTYLTNETTNDDTDNEEKDEDSEDEKEDEDEDEIPSIPTMSEYERILGEMLKEGEHSPEKEIKFICVVSINSTISKSIVTVIPGDSLAYIGNTGMSLTWANYFAGLPELSYDDLMPATVTAATGIVPDFYGYVDIDDFVKLADTLGNVQYNNPSTLVTSKKTNGKPITVPAGKITLDSEKLSALLEYDDYRDRYSASQTLIDVSISMLDRICSKFKPNILAQVRKMLDVVETDFTTADMSAVSSIFFSYENTEKTGLAILGAYEDTDIDVLFKINTASTVEKFKQYLN